MVVRSDIEVTEHGAIVRGDLWRVSTGAGSKGGGKGGGGSSKTPSESPNSLRSRDTASVLYLIGEGEIEGFPNGDILRNTYLDEVPIMNADGSLNFQNVAVEWRPGTQNQSYISGFSDVESEIQVGVKVTTTLGAIVRTLNDPNADAVVVRLMTPQLQTIDEKSGDVRGGRIDFRIEIATGAGGYQTVVEAAIEGKCTSAYARSYRIPLPKPGTTWNVRVTRITPDSNSTRISDELYWQSYKSIIETKLSYPNSALFGIRISAEQFRQIPKTSIKLRGNKWQYPSNYNPTTRTYTGIWNRTFSYGYTNNPAWVYYGVLTDPIFGCGNYLDASQVDIDALYAIAQYCDELVADGKGGWEPRFTINAYIDSQEAAYDVINTLAGVFRGMTFWAGGQITAVQDAPSSPVRMYGESSVIQEVDESGRITTPPFSYSGTGRKARHTAAIVSYSDPNDFYRTKAIYVENREGLLKYGYRETKIVAFGCTSQGQAYRVGQWLLYTENFETETVTFTVGSLGAIARPGEIIQTSDPTRAGSLSVSTVTTPQPWDFSIENGFKLSIESGFFLSLGAETTETITTGGVQWHGRLVSGTTTTLNLDRTVLIESGKTYQVSIYRSDTGVIETRAVTTGAGNQTTLTVSPAFSLAPVAQSEWLLQANDLVPETWRVLTVTEKAAHQYTITAIAHNPSKYAAIEQGFTLQDLPVSKLPNLIQRPEPPGNLTITETLYESGASGVRTKVDITFSASPSPGIDRYQIEYQLQGDPAGYTVLAQASPNNLNFVWFNVQPGLYSFRVSAFNQLGVQSGYVEIVRQIAGLQAPPADVTNFTLTRSGSQALLRWDPSPDLDVITGGQFIIKFTPKLSAVTWSDGFDLPIVSGASSNAIVPLSLGTYLIKAVDSSGNQSINFASVSSSFAIAQSTNIVQALTESPTFPGTRTNCTVNGPALALTSTTFFDAQSGLFDARSGLFDAASPETFDSTPGLFNSQTGFFDNANTVSDLVLSGIYDFSAPIDLGAVFNCRISANLSASVATNRSFFDARNELFDSVPGLFDGTDLTGASATLQISISQDGSTYGAWSNFSIGDYTGRAFRFRVLLESQTQNTNILVDQLAVTVDMPDRDEQGASTSTGSIQTINFTRAFWTSSTPVVAVTLINGANGDYPVLQNITNSSFQIQVFNSSGVGISGRQFNWLARGFGQAS